MRVGDVAIVYRHRNGEYFRGEFMGAVESEEMLWAARLEARNYSFWSPIYRVRIKSLK